MAQRPDSSAGTSTGFQLWLFFMISFALLRYPPTLSVFLGAVAGVAGGLVAAWWNAKEDFLVDEPSRPTEQAEVRLAEPPPSRPLANRRPGFGVKPIRRKTRATRRFGWFFRRRK
ncbi:hypothetical protein ACN4EK_04325 [Pantanalinema rosaneae CENA516]|uniref:hypothetical protein n=1 Tax=Pantanalinema rosaneae TaxID=1620701 RepID=UPI003D6FA53F